MSSQRRAYSLWAIVVYCAFALTRPDGKLRRQINTRARGHEARCMRHAALPPSFAVRSVRICPFQLSNKRGDRHVGANSRYLLSTCDSCPQLWTWKCNSNSKVGWGNMESGHEACSCTACQASISGSEPAGSFFIFYSFYFIFQISCCLLVPRYRCTYLTGWYHLTNIVRYLSVFTPKSIPSAQIEILLF